MRNENWHCQLVEFIFRLRKWTSEEGFYTFLSYHPSFSLTIQGIRCDASPDPFLWSVAEAEVGIITIVIYSILLHPFTSLKWM